MFGFLVPVLGDSFAAAKLSNDKLVAAANLWALGFCCKSQSMDEARAPCPANLALLGWASKEAKLRAVVSPEKQEGPKSEGGPISFQGPVKKQVGREHVEVIANVLMVQESAQAPVGSVGCTVAPAEPCYAFLPAGNMPS